MAELRIACHRAGPKRIAYAATCSLADWLALAAAPTFAIMALQTVIAERNAPDMLCAAIPTSPISGMVVMYLLMSAFHVSPWLKLAARAHEKSRQA